MMADGSTLFIRVGLGFPQLTAQISNEEIRHINQDASRMRVLSKEEVLQDAQVLLRPSGNSVKASSFALCMVSPVFHKMVCGGFREGWTKELVLEDVEESLLQKVLSLCLSGVDVEVRDLVEAIQLGKLAERLQMVDVRSAVEEMVVKDLTIEQCAEVLSASQWSGLSKVEARSRRMALEGFEELARTPGYITLSEELVESLLEDDELDADSEEAVFEAALCWMTARGGLRGEGLLKKIRFGVISEDYLQTAAANVIGDNELLNELVQEARLAKDEGEKFGTVQQEKKLEQRKGRGVHLNLYAGGEERRISGHNKNVLALAACEGRVCSGSEDGTVRVWNRASLAAEHVLGAEEGSPVLSVVWWEGRVVSGHGDGKLRLWSESGTCDTELDGHTGGCTALAVCGDRLLSGSQDRTIGVWKADSARAGGARAKLERTLLGHGDCVCCLAAWGGAAISGSGDKTIRVWDLEGGAGGVPPVAVLEGHTGSVTSLAMCGRKLASASFWDKTIRTWAAGTWTPLQTAQAGPTEWVYCLAAGRGGRLVCGVHSHSTSPPGCEIWVWRLDGLRHERTLAQPSGSHVWSLAAAGGEVWGGVGNEVVVWRRTSAT